ncbi:MAG: acetyl-CoA decarbonylase/synthase complex subunit gamma [Candidatus Omnitrophica bacterium]|jgi:acetyl-CoA decarbonylase/synthase complex subunit gamma|nr:acetyl-CoA decarbonylase/synthase complex subunit gamma [Candidatus Omnitrophota bacterium]
MALSGLDIYKLLPKTNCRQCGIATCLAFAMQLAKKGISIDKCPFLSNESKKILEESSQPPIKLVSIGTGENKLDIGNESVLFRHEEKFHNPCGIGIILEDTLKETEILHQINKINSFVFERVGQKLEVNLIALKQTGCLQNFIKLVQTALKNTKLAIVLMVSDIASLEQAIKISKDQKPLIYPDENISQEAAALAKENKLAMVVKAGTIEEAAAKTESLAKAGLNDLIIDSGDKNTREKLWDLTQIRRQALKKSNRLLGYPAIVTINKADPLDEIMEAATYICKYSGIVLLKHALAWEALSLLTLRQNIYTDPQKPLQIEPKIYTIGNATVKSPIMITTNFSLSYYTVLGEVEASKIPSHIISMDTEGMSVLTAWAAEKFTPEKIANALIKLNADKAVSHKNLIIPGYVAVLSGELEEKSGWKITVGPKEASGLPAFLKNYSAG